MYDRSEADYAEDVATRIMWRIGFPDARSTQRSNDGGLDVVSASGVAQVKWQEAKVGRPALQNLVGAAHGREVALLFFARTGYTVAAVNYAAQTGIELYTFDLRDTCAAWNDLARDRIRYYRDVQAAERESAETNQKAEWAREAAELMAAQEREQAAALRMAQEQAERERARQQRWAQLDPVVRTFLARCSSEGLTAVTLWRRSLTVVRLLLSAYFAGLLLFLGISELVSGRQNAESLSLSVLIAVLFGYMAYRSFSYIRHTRLLPRPFRLSHPLPRQDRQHLQRTTP